MAITTPDASTGLIIDGQWVRPDQGARYDIENPAAPAEIVGHATSASRDETHMAIEAARRAAPGWAALSWSERIAQLRHAAERLDADLEARVELFVREHGKVRAEAHIEMTRLAGRFQLTADLAERAGADQTLAGPRFLSTVVHKPIGVVGLIVPWNWPLSILGAKLPQALVAGNTVVVKMSEMAPLAPMQTIKLLADALPPGVLNAVTGEVDAVGVEMLSNPYIGKIDFTGSTSAGRSIMRDCAPTLKRLTLELGGNDAAIVLPDAELDEAAVRRIAVGTFLTTGQVCMSIKRLYVHRSRYEELLDGLRTVVDEHVVGNGLDERSTMGPLNNRRQLDVVTRLVAEARDKGARVDELGTKLDAEEFDRGYFHLPTLVTDVDHSFSVVSEEQFGPVLPVMAFDTEEEAVALANDSEYGLCSSVWSADVDHALDVARRLEAGTTYINAHGPTAQDDHAPFGGVKQSGVGRQLGAQGIVEFTQLQSISQPA